MDKYLLTPEEIIKARRNTIDGVNGIYEAVCKAQLAKALPLIREEVRKVLLKRMGQKRVKCSDCDNADDYINITRNECIKCVMDKIFGIEGK